MGMIKIFGDEMKFPNAMIAMVKGAITVRVAFRIQRRSFAFGLWGWKWGCKPFAYTHKLAL